MADAAAQTSDQQASSQSSSQSGSQSQSAADTGAQAAAAASADQNNQNSGDQSATVTRPEGIPDSYWDAEKNTLKIDPAALANDLKQRDELLAFKSAEDSRKLSLPANPDGYEIKLPDGFQAPEGVTFEFNKDDPLLARAREIAHAKGLDQETFQDMLGVYAAAQVADQQTIKDAKDAEIAKLGVNGPARVDAVQNWTKARVGEADAAVLSTMLVTAAHVSAFEKLMRSTSSQGTQGFDQRHREQQDTKPTNEEFSSWSYAEQREYQSSGKRPQRAA